MSREEDATDGAATLDRDSLKISVKVFILSTKPGVLNDAMDKGMFVKISPAAYIIPYSSIFFAESHPD